MVDDLAVVISGWWLVAINLVTDGQYNGNGGL